MKQTHERIGKFKRIEPHLYKREYQTSNEDWSVKYYGRFTCRLKKKRRIFPLGSDLLTARDELTVLAARNVRREDFDDNELKTSALTFSEWSGAYLRTKGVKDKRSLENDRRMIRLHLNPFFGSMLLTEFTRGCLERYIDAREKETIIRRGKPSKKRVARETISNELACLRAMLRVAVRGGNKVSIPPFEELIVREKKGGRALSIEERKKVLSVYPKWLARLAEFATETCLSEGDLLRLTEQMIDRGACEITPEGGRLKTKTNQVSPLTERARQILDEIKREKVKTIAPKAKDLIFIREDGRMITRSMIAKAVEKAFKEAKVKKFVFHNYRNTALTDWTRRGIHVDIAMRASGHTSVEMHKLYVDLQDGDVARAFGLLHSIGG